MPLPTRVLNTHLRSGAGTGGGLCQAQPFSAFWGRRPTKHGGPQGVPLLPESLGGERKGRWLGRGAGQGPGAGAAAVLPFLQGASGHRLPAVPALRWGCPSSAPRRDRAGEGRRRLKLRSRMRAPNGAFLLIFISKDYFSRGNCLN